MPQITKQHPTRIATNHNKTSSVLNRIAPIGFQDQEGIKLLLYGRSGTGKTTLWATFPKPILAIICSGGNKPGELRSINTPEYRKVISQVTLQKSSEIKELVEHAASGNYQTVVLDHGSGLQDLILKEVLGLEELPAQKSWGMASQQAYGQTSGAAKDMFRMLLNLSCNVVIVAQERNFNEDTDSELILPTVGAGLIPSLAGWLNAAVDYIGQTFIKQKEESVTRTIGTGKQAKNITTKTKMKGVDYCLRTAPDPVYTTKFRLPRDKEVPEIITDPSFDKIAKIIRS